jgi:hypothetical protein
VRFNPNRLVAAFASNAGLMAPILLVAAVGTTYFAASSIKAASTSVAIKARNTDEHTSISLTKTPISDDLVMRSAERLARLSPAVRVSVAGRAVVVSATSAEHFAEFMHALSTLQTTSADVVWEAEDICLSACEGGDSARARVTGYKQSIKSNT